MKIKLGILTCFLILSFSAISQDTLSKKETRKQQKNFLLPGRPWTIEVPLWIPGFGGEFVYGDIDIEGEDGGDPGNPPIDPPGNGIGDILDRLFTKEWYLKFFYLTKMSYENKNFLVQLDGMTGEVGNSVKFNYNNKEIVQANFRTLNFRLLLGYRIVNVRSSNKRFQYELYGYLGARLYFQRIYSDLDGLVNKLDISPTRGEPVFGLQNQFTWKRWFLVVQGDYGGLFNDQKRSFQLTTYTYYRTGRFISLKLGWNHLDLYHKGNFRAEDYIVNVTLSGPSVGIVFLF